MLTLRLQRTGKTGQPNFRVVLQEHTDPVKREAMEVLGYYRPATKEKTLKLDLERIKFWISKGAQVSDTLAVLLKAQNVAGMENFIEPRNKKRGKKGSAAPAAQAPAPASAAPAAQAPAATAPTEPAAPTPPAQ